MDFEELYKSIRPTDQSILEAVDEYTLYCFYSGIDDLILGKAYSAPYRKDDVPSFAVYPSNKERCEFFWKDHATNESGDVFRFIQRMLNLAYSWDVYSQINQDFGLTYDLEQPKQGKIVLYSKPIVNIVKVRTIPQPLTKKGIEFWSRLHVTREILDQYSTEQVLMYWLAKEQEHPNLALDPTFSYRIGDHYQIYSPTAPREYKFRNDLPENYFFGYVQLPPTGDTLIIDKSMKDVLFCRSLGYWAIAPKSETTLVPERKMWELKDRFKNIYLTLDNDKAGRTASDKYKLKYDFLRIRFLQQFKDKTDACIDIGYEQTKLLVQELIHD